MMLLVCSLQLNMGPSTAVRRLMADLCQIHVFTNSVVLFNQEFCPSCLFALTVFAYLLADLMSGWFYRVSLILNVFLKFSSWMGFGEKSRLSLFTVSTSVTNCHQTDLSFLDQPNVPEGQFSTTFTGEIHINMWVFCPSNSLLSAIHLCFVSAFSSPFKA